MTDSREQFTRNAGCFESSGGTWAEGGVDGEVLGWEKCGDFRELKGSHVYRMRLCPCGPNEGQGSLLGKKGANEGLKKYVQ